MPSVGLSAWGSVLLSSADPLPGDRSARSLGQDFSWALVSWSDMALVGLAVSELGAWVTWSPGSEHWTRRCRLGSGGVGVPRPGEVLGRLWASCCAGAAFPAMSPCRGRWEQLTEAQTAVGGRTGVLVHAGKGRHMLPGLGVHGETRAAPFGRSLVAV